MFNRKGFTLVELMIVVAIIGILAAIAIPNFVAMQYRAKRAEVMPNINGIKTAELAYDASNDVFVEQSSFVPRSVPGDATAKAPVPWDTGTAFQTLNWAPDGEVRGGYMVTSSSSTDFEVTGQINVDGDPNLASFTCSKEANAKMNTQIGRAHV